MNGPRLNRRERMALARAAITGFFSGLTRAAASRILEYIV